MHSFPTININTKTQLINFPKQKHKWTCASKHTTFRHEQKMNGRKPKCQSSVKKVKGKKKLKCHSMLGKNKRTSSSQSKGPQQTTDIVGCFSSQKVKSLWISKKRNKFRSGIVSFHGDSSSFARKLRRQLVWRWLQKHLA